jgi:hypothetical protein
VAQRGGQCRARDQEEVGSPPSGSGAAQWGARAVGGNFSDGSRCPEREPRRSKISTLGQKMRRRGPCSLAQGGYFRFRPVARRKEAAQLARFRSIWLSVSGETAPTPLGLTVEPHKPVDMHVACAVFQSHAHVRSPHQNASAVAVALLSQWSERAWDVRLNA